MNYRKIRLVPILLCYAFVFTNHHARTMSNRESKIALQQRKADVIVKATSQPIVVKRKETAKTKVKKKDTLQKRSISTYLKPQISEKK